MGKGEQSAVSCHTPSRRSVALPPLRFPSLAVTCSGEDSHLQDDAHAGRTRGRALSVERARHTMTGRGNDYSNRALTPDQSMDSVATEASFSGRTVPSASAA